MPERVLQATGLQTESSGSVWAILFHDRSFADIISHSHIEQAGGSGINVGQIHL